MEGKMLIKTSGEQGIAIECDLKKVNLADKFHLLYCVEQVLNVTDTERMLYNVTRNHFEKDSEQIMIDLSKIGGSL